MSTSAVSSNQCNHRPPTLVGMTKSTRHGCRDLYLQMSDLHGGLVAKLRHHKVTRVAALIGIRFGRYLDDKNHT